jgi:hypothetical protein
MAVDLLKYFSKIIFTTTSLKNGLRKLETQQLYFLAEFFIFVHNLFTAPEALGFTHP